MKEQDHKPIAELIKRALTIADPDERQQVIEKIKELQEVEANVEWLLKTKAVAKITGQEFQKRPDKDLVTQVTEYYKSIGGEVERQGIGTVILERTGVKSSIGHKLGRKKAAAFAAVPDIIKKGIVIDHQTNWKGRGYETYVIGAPISIGREGYIGEVVLTRKTGTAKFYLHEVETQEKLRGASVQAGTESGTPLGASRLIIGKKLDEVKKNISKIIARNDELVTENLSKLTIDRQLQLAKKAGYVEGVCECVAAIGEDHTLGKKLLTEMNVTKDMAHKYAKPETYKALEQGIFAPQQKLEQTQSIKL